MFTFSFRGDGIVGDIFPSKFPPCCSTSASVAQMQSQSSLVLSVFNLSFSHFVFLIFEGATSSGSWRG